VTGRGKNRTPLLCGRPAKASFPSGVSRNCDDVISLIVRRRPTRSSLTKDGESVDTRDPVIKSGRRSFVPRYAVGQLGAESDEEFSFVVVNESLWLLLML